MIKEEQPWLLGGGLKLKTDKQPATETRQTYQDKMCKCTHMMPHMGHSSTASHLQEGNILKSLRKRKKKRGWWEGILSFLLSNFGLLHQFLPTVPRGMMCSGLKSFKVFFFLSYWNEGFVFLKGELWFWTNTVPQPLSSTGHKTEDAKQSISNNFETNFLF